MTDDSPADQIAVTDRSDGVGRLAAKRVQEDADKLSASPTAAGLYVVATPIGNLGDITLRALATLSAVDAIYAEDTRRTGQLLAHFGIRSRLAAYHDHSGDTTRARIADAIAQGQKIALVSDAGTPLVSDPGYKLVTTCLARGLNVFALPGPAAPLAALTVSGLPTDAFVFAGFLPSKSSARQTHLAAFAATPATLIVFETAPRLVESLADMMVVFGGDRPVVVARELTKLHEEVRRGSLADVHGAMCDAATLKGEIVVVIGPPPETDITDGQIETALTAALADMTLRDAAKQVAAALGVAKTRVYDLGLRLKTGRQPTAQQTFDS